MKEYNLITPNNCDIFYIEKVTSIFNGTVDNYLFSCANIFEPVLQISMKDLSQCNAAGIILIENRSVNHYAITCRRKLFLRKLISVSDGGSRSLIYVERLKDSLRLSLFIV